MFKLENLVTSVSRYFITRETKYLDEAIAMLQGEKDDPCLQEAIMSLQMTMDEVEKVAREEGHISLPTQANGIDADGPVEAGKIIRVICSDQPEESCMLLNVAHLDESKIILVPVGGMTE